jgi:hypothetical protein
MQSFPLLYAVSTRGALGDDTLCVCFAGLTNILMRRASQAPQGAKPKVKRDMYLPGLTTQLTDGLCHFNFARV